MSNTVSDFPVCDICACLDNLFIPSESSVLQSFSHPYKFLCVDCFPEYIDKVTKWPYLFRNCPRN